MTKPKKSGIILAIIAVSVLIVVSAVGWSVYSGKKVQRDTRAQAVSQVSAGKTPTNGQTGASQANTETSPKVAPDPYEGWKTYCDSSTEKVCFKYPADWAIYPSSRGDSVGVIIINPSASVNGLLDNNNNTRFSPFPPIYIASLDDLSTPNANYRVVGEIEDGSDGRSWPEYEVLDTPFTTGMTTGQKANMNGTEHLSFKHSYGYFRLGSAKASKVNVDQAKAWFKTDDAKTALLIARSFYLE